MLNDAAVPNLSVHDFDTSDESEFDRETPTAVRRRTKWPTGSQPMPAVLHQQDDLTVHVQIDDQIWHKKAVGGDETACAIKIHYGHILGMRVESYLGELCPTCFTDHERNVLAPKARAREKMQTDQLEAQREADWEKWKKDRDTGRWPLVTDADVPPDEEPTNPTNPQKPKKGG